MANPWFRLYSEFANDPKVQLMSECMQRRLVMIFCMRNDGIKLNDEAVGFTLRLSAADVTETRLLFVEKGFIETRGNAWSVTNWNQRQFISDSSTDRVKRFRERKKRDETLHETNETVTVTAPEQKQNRTEQNRISKASPSHPAVVGEGKGPDLQIYEAYPRKEGRSDGLRAISKAVTRIFKANEGGLHFADTTEVRRWLWKTVTTYARSPAGQNPDRTKIPHPATWFNQSRYLDDQSNWQLGGNNGIRNGNGQRPTKNELGSASYDETKRMLEDRAKGRDGAVGPGDDGGARQARGADAARSEVGAGGPLLEGLL